MGGAVDAGWKKTEGSGQGFFALGDTPVPATGAGSSNADHAKDDVGRSDEHHVLIIRQRAAIHHEIEQLIADLLYPDAEEYFPGSLPRNSWKSRLKPETTGSTP